MQVTLTKRKSAAPQAPVPWAKALSALRGTDATINVHFLEQMLHPMYNNTLAARSMSGGAM